MQTSKNPQPVVLYVENNPDDRFFLERQVKKSEACFSLVSVSDIHSAQNSLRAARAPRPAVALLDYTLDGGRTGLEVLRWIRQQPALYELPVIMYSSGELPEIVTACYREGAQHFIHKCPNLDRVREFVKCLDQCLRRQPTSFETLLRLQDYARPQAEASPIRFGLETKQRTSI